MSKMNPEIKARWVAALRSGGYRQGKRRLRSADGACYCCLGVLADLAAQEGVGSWVKDEGDDYMFMAPIGFATLPQKVQDWAQLSDSCGSAVDIHGRSASLTCHNDAGRTFAEIADAIEAQL